MTYTIPDQWADALDAFRLAQTLKGAPPSTVKRRMTHMRRFAATTDLAPWHVTNDDVHAWLDALDIADSTKRTMRDSLRSFYRWAHTSGRTVTDPTEEPSHRALRLPTPEQWQQPFTAYERALWARGVASTTIHTYMETLRTFARENASADPYGITVSDLHEWMAGKAWARETRRGRKSTLASFYGWAVDTEHMTVDPTLKLPTVKAGDPVARPATDAEYTAALERAGERWELALRLGAELGLRRGEVARVHSADVVDRGEAGSWLTVHGKGAKVRTLPLSASLALSLRTRPPGYVYPGRIVEKQRARGEGHISARYLGKRIEQLLPDGVTMHALRHRFATRAYNVNRDVFTVQKLLGHASAATTQRYVQVADDRMRALVEAVSG